MDNSNYLIKRIAEMPSVKIATEPVMNVVGITNENDESICTIDEKLRKRNWLTGKFVDFNLIRIVIMPHVQKIHLKNFCDDLEKITN